MPSKRPTKRIKKEPEDDAQSVTQDEPKVETTIKPWEDKKDYEAIFRKYISIGDDGEEHYDVIDMERDAQSLEKPLFSIGLISSCADQFSSCALLSVWNSLFTCIFHNL